MSIITREVNSTVIVQRVEEGLSRHKSKKVQDELESLTPTAVCPIESVRE